MGYRLSWDDNNLAEDGHRVYRSTSEMDPNNLPEPLAVLGPDVTVYEDISAEEGIAYYYRVSAFKGDSEAVSAEIATDGDDPGPGPGGGFPPGAEIGDLVAGGVYVGDIEYPDGRKFHIIFGLQVSEASGLRWGPSGATGATDANDGMANQELILARGDGESYNAFVYCRDYVDGDGNNDYYLPAQNELALEANVRAHPELNTSRTTYRWTSTEDGSNNAWARRFSGGGTVGNKTDTSRLVRPVRRVEFQ